MFEPRWQTEISSSLLSQTNLLYNGNRGSSPEVKANPHIAPRLRMSRPIPLLLLCACMQCYGETFTLTSFEMWFRVVWYKSAVSSRNLHNYHWNTVYHKYPNTYLQLRFPNQTSVGIYYPMITKYPDCLRTFLRLAFQVLVKRYISTKTCVMSVLGSLFIYLWGPKNYILIPLQSQFLALS